MCFKCPTCGAEVENEDRYFCIECGAKGVSEKTARIDAIALGSLDTVPLLLVALFGAMYDLAAGAVVFALWVVATPANIYIRWTKGPRHEADPISLTLLKLIRQSSKRT